MVGRVSKMWRYKVCLWSHIVGWSVGCLKWGGRCCGLESGFGDSPASPSLTALGEGSGEYLQLLYTGRMCCDVSSFGNYFIYSTLNYVCYVIVHPILAVIMLANTYHCGNKTFIFSI